MSSTTIPEPLLMTGDNIKGRWRVIRRLGKGAFGEVYEGIDLSSDRHVAIKVEASSSNKQVLQMEVTVLKELQHTTKHVCQFRGSGRGVGYNFIVMDLMDCNLAELRRRRHKGIFSYVTIALLAVQMIVAIQTIHDKGYLHRDIKPSNFCIGLGEGQNRTVFILDFGLARRYITSTGEVRSPRVVAGFRGTGRYASLRAHQSKELSRRDDLWSLFYLLVEFALGALPWRKLTDKDHIAKAKISKKPVDLVRNLPTPFKQFEAYIESLEYADRPNYELMQSFFLKLLVSYDGDMNSPFDWEVDTPLPSKEERISSSDTKPEAAKVNVISVGPIVVQHRSKDRRRHAKHHKGSHRKRKEVNAAIDVGDLAVVEVINEAVVLSPDIVTSMDLVDLGTIDIKLEAMTPPPDATALVSPDKPSKEVVYNDFELLPVTEAIAMSDKSDSGDVCDELEIILKNIDVSHAVANGNTEVKDSSDPPKSPCMLIMKKSNELITINERDPRNGSDKDAVPVCHTRHEEPVYADLKSYDQMSASINLTDASAFLNNNIYPTKITVTHGDSLLPDDILFKDTLQLVHINSMDDKAVEIENTVESVDIHNYGEISETELLRQSPNTMVSSPRCCLTENSSTSSAPRYLQHLSNNINVGKSFIVDENEMASMHRIQLEHSTSVIVPTLVHTTVATRSFDIGETLTKISPALDTPNELFERLGKSHKTVTKCSESTSSLSNDSNLRAEDDSNILSEDLRRDFSFLSRSSKIEEGDAEVSLKLSSLNDLLMPGRTIVTCTSGLGIRVDIRATSNRDDVDSFSTASIENNPSESHLHKRCGDSRSDSRVGWATSSIAPIDNVDISLYDCEYCDEVKPELVLPPSNSNVVPHVAHASTQTSLIAPESESETRQKIWSPISVLSVASSSGYRQDDEASCLLDDVNGQPLIKRISLKTPNMEISNISKVEENNMNAEILLPTKVVGRTYSSSKSDSNGSSRNSTSHNSSQDLASELSKSMPSNPSQFRPIPPNSTLPRPVHALHARRRRYNVNINNS